MNCNNCEKKEATVRFTQVVDTQKQTQWLCEDCASSEGLLDLAPPKLSLTVETVKAEPSAGADTEDDAQAQRMRCPECRTSLAQVRRNGRVGCPTCYATFSEYLEPLLRRIHSSLQHAGSGPEDGGERSRREASLRTLRSQLVVAITHEDFERAASLRDAIERLGGDPDAAEESR